MYLGHLNPPKAYFLWSEKLYLKKGFDDSFFLHNYMDFIYVFHEDTETFTVVYTEFSEDYQAFYDRCCADMEKAKQTRSYGLDGSKLNYFDASYIPWLSYEALHVELPDGHLHFPPIINWGKYHSENGRLLMPVTVRMNHAIADGYVVSKAFLLLEKEIERLVED